MHYVSTVYPENEQTLSLYTKITRRPKIIVLSFMIFVAGLLDTQSLEAQSLSLYDAFGSSLINPRRWFGEEGRANGGLRTEARRAIVSGQARIENRTWGDTLSDTGTSSTSNRLVALRSPTITAMRGTITVRDHRLIACAANASPGAVRARLFGFYFNAGEFSLGNSFNDVFAGVQLQRFSNSTDPANIFRVVAFLGICNDESCFSTSSLGSQNLGTVALNTATTVEVRWERTNNRFVFQRDANAPVNLPYTVPDSEPASSPSKRIEVSNVVQRCTSTPRPVAFMAADFDDIMIATSSTLAPQRTLVRANVVEESVADTLIGPAN